MKDNNKNKTNVPNLRFPGFEEEWERKRLGEVADKVMYGMNAAAIPFDGINKYLRITDIDDISRRFKANPLTSPSGEIEEKYQLKVGDIVLTRTGASVGKSYLYNPNDGKLLFAGFLIKFSIINANPYFVFSQTLKSNYNKWVQKMSMRSGQPGINAEEYKDLELAFPAISEQDKISTFLSLIDERIQCQNKIIEELKSFKSEVSRKTFSQEFRFKDENGEDFAEWKVKKLGEVSDVRDGTHDSPKYHETGYPFITSKNLLKNGSIDFENVTFINKMDYDKFNGRSKVEINDILFGMIGTIGNPVLVKSNGFAIKNVALIKQKDGLLNVFLIHFLKGDSINQQFFEQNTGGTQKFLSLSIIRNLSVIVPSIREQTKISDFLSGIDEKIDLETSLLQQLKLQKQYFLQQMFI